VTRAPGPEEFYDAIGSRYATTRHEDPRIAAAIHAALGDARTVLNVGAGTGNYEPRDRDVTAVEPSTAMIAARPPGAARVVRAHAETLPFEDSTFDAVMAVLSDHHWRDRARGLRELRRVARQRVVVFTWDPRFRDSFWLTRDYLPGFKRVPGMSIAQIVRCLGGAHVEPVLIPHDCSDGFYHAFWRRPSAYLDHQVRTGISVFALVDERETDGMVQRLRSDLDSGVWARRYGELSQLEAIDLGYRLIVAGLPPASAT
jgi:SAM-dependent methyltransferase